MFTYFRAESLDAHLLLRQEAGLLREVTKLIVHSQSLFENFVERSTKVDPLYLTTLSYTGDLKDPPELSVSHYVIIP